MSAPGRLNIQSHHYHDIKMQKIKFALLGVILLLISSCKTTKDLQYFDTISALETGVIGNVTDYELKIRPDDELLITVNSIDPKASMMYNLPLANPAVESDITSSGSPTQQTYLVNAAGDITMPVIGKIHVGGMTTTQLTDYLTQRISENVKDPLVKVSMVNFGVSVMGEVKAPKILSANTERLSVLDAIAACGDLTEYGRRDNVLIIREENGKKTFQRLNLHDASIVTSPYFYLQQNDVVYVEPNPIKQTNSKYSINNGYKLSVISTIVSSVSVIASLIIALTR